MNDIEIQTILRKKPADVTTEEKRMLFKAMAGNTSQARALRIDFAALQSEALQPVLSEESFVERIFNRVDTGGEQILFPIRSKKVRSAWYSTGTDSVPQRTSEMKETHFNTFWLEAGVDWKLDLMKTGNMQLVDDLLDDMVGDLAYKVNYSGMALIKWAEKVGDLGTIARLTTAPGGGAKLSLPVVRAITTFLEQRTEGRVKASDIFLSVSRYNELIELSQFASAGAGANELNLPQEVRERLYAGGIEGLSSFFVPSFNITLHKVRRTEFINDDKAYIFDRASFGKMPVDDDLETMDDDSGKKRFKMGVIGRQRQGFGISDVEAGAVYYFSDTPNVNDDLFNDAPSAPAFSV